MLDWLFGRKKQQEPPKQQQKKKKKSKQEAEAEDRWKYQFLVQFLCSPIWKVSILDFVDNKCIVFDNQEENKFQYTTIHKEFKQLVGTLFDGMMQQVGLDEDKLAELLEKGFESKQKKIFNQLLLCDDFMRFKQLMLKRNKVLQEEAMKQLHETNSGLQKKPSKLQKQKQLFHESQRLQEQRKRMLLQQQEQTLRKVLEMSMIQARQQQAISKLQQKTNEYQTSKVHKHQEKSPQQNKVVKKVIEDPKNVQQQNIVKQQPKKMPTKLQSLKKTKIDHIDSNNSAKNSNLSDLPPLKQSQLNDLPPLKNNLKKDQFDHEAKKQIKEEKPKQKLIEQELKKQGPQQVQAPSQSQDDRKRRLLQQRQKIRRKKQEERRKQMEQQQRQKQHTQQQNVHTIVLQEDGIHESRVGVKEQDNKDKISEDEVKRRKQLMQKIKNRIVDDF